MLNPERKAARSWAQKHLGLSETADRAAIQTEFLRRLGRESFVPPVTADYALQVLAGSAEPAVSDLGRQQARVAMESDLGKEVDVFARRFFEVPPATRQQVWQDLWWRCCYIRQLNSRLSWLKPALNLLPCEKVGRTGPSANLVQKLSELYVLRPAERAVRREAIVDEIGDEMELWERTAKDLRTRHFDLAALDQALVALLADRELFEQYARQATKESVKARAASASSGWRPSGWVLFAAIVILNILRTLFTPSSPSLNTAPDRPHFQAPNDWGIKFENGKIVPVPKDKPTQPGDAVRRLLDLNPVPKSKPLIIEAPGAAPSKSNDANK